MLVGASLAVTAVAVGLLIFALISRSQAVSAQTIAKSRALAAQSEAQASVNPQLAILLGEQAVKTSPTPQALFALRAALDSSPLRTSLANPSLQCGSYGGPGVAYDPAAPRIVEALCNGEVRIFDSSSGHLLRRTRVGGPASSLAYSADGKTLVVGGRGRRSVLDGQTARQRFHLAGGRETAVAITPDGSLIAASSPFGVGIWAIEAGVPHVLKRQGPRGGIPAGSVPVPGLGTPETLSVALLEDGRYLLVGGGGPGGIRVYQTRPLKLLETLPGTGFDNSIATSPDGRTFAVMVTSQGHSPGGTASVWASHTRKRLFTVAHFPGLEIASAAFSSDGTRIALGMADGKGGLWSTVTHEQLASYLGPTAAVTALAFSPDGRYVTTISSDGTANVWRASGPEEAFIDTAVGALFGSGPIALSANRVTVLGAGERATLVRNFTFSGTLAGAPLRIPPSAGAGLSEDGSLIAAGGASPSVYRRAEAFSGPPSFGLEIWNRAQRRVIGRVQTTVGIGEVQFSHDGRMVALFDSVAPAVAEVATGRRVPLRNARACGAGWRSATFSGDGRLVAGADFCGNVTVWNTASGRMLAAFKEGGEVSRIAFDPRNDSELAVGSWDSQITIWNARTSRVLRVLTGHAGGVASIAYSPDGTLLASGSLDDTARVWNPNSGRLLRVLEHPDPVTEVTFSPDGRTLATGDVSGIVRIWDACTACENANALLALARQRVTRQLTPLQRKTFLGGL